MILEVEYQAAKRRVELYESIGVCAAKALGARLSKTAKALNAILSEEFDAYVEAQEVVEQHSREETARIMRRLEAHARTQMLLQPEAVL